MTNDKLIIENGNVILIDPNYVNINTDMVNSIPQYQDMYIFTELVAENKGRTVIINGKATSNKPKKINFIGNNQNDNTNDPNYLNFTTNYYDGSNPNGQYYEGFGINNIKISINSSFIPQVNIQFIDVRGLAFFNQQDSPYKMLFDFPPPIFTLTIKGYYGKAITYQLHLVKYTSEFSAENGNFIIDAQFVAVTFAPLSDVLFRYIVNAPLINNEDSMKPETGSAPKNTFELIMKLRNLYATISNKLKTDSENQEYNLIEKQIEIIESIINIINSVVNKKNENLNAQGKPYLIISTSSNESNYVSVRPSENYNLNIVNNLNQYNDLIKNEETTGIKVNLNNRLYITYIAGTNIALTSEDYVPSGNTSSILDAFAYDTANYNGFNNVLTDFKTNLLENILPSFNIQTTDIGIPQPFSNGKNIETNENSETQYYGIDITNYYYKIYKKYLELIENKNELSIKISQKINNMVSQNLGMTPSIYNVFKIILDDVDTFFSILRKTSKDAASEHNSSEEVIKIISGNNIDSPASNANIPDYIYSFPLIINQSNIYNGTKQERVAPINLSNKVRFPELELVTNFMDTFVKQRNISKLYDARINQNDDGTYKWIPISPMDSVLGNVSPESPYLNINDDIRAEISKIFLKRFYILSQGSIYNSFYNLPSTKRDAYINMYAASEAINITTTLTSELIISNLKQMADEYGRNIDGFYEYVSGITDTYNNGTGLINNNLYDFPENDPKYFPITPSNPYDGRVYVDKNNLNFIGVNWYTNDIIINERDKGKNINSPIDNFNSDAKNSWFKQLVYGNPTEYYNYKFTDENVIYISDVNNDNDTIINGLSLYTRYLTNAVDDFDIGGYPNPNFPGYNKNLSISQVGVIGQPIAYRTGNSSFKSYGGRDYNKLKYGNNIIDVWKKQLANHDIVDIITGSSSQNLASIILLSNFGTTASPFNIYPNSLNSLVFDTPAAIETPAFYGPYLGVLLNTLSDETLLNEVLEFFTGITGSNGIGNVFDNWGFYVLADLHDVQYYLSNNDKEKFINSYISFETTLLTIRNGIKSMCDDIRKNNVFSSESEGVEYYLNPTAKKIKNATGVGIYSYLIEYMMKRNALINFTQITFQMQTSYPIGYSSIKTLNSDENKKNVNKLYFEKFFSKLSSELKRTNEEKQEQEEEANKIKGDSDIITQLYYSFKNINDKWLTGSLNNNEYYPFNKPQKKLIDSFAFVDRAMNPIGDTILNAEILIDMFNDPNLSLFSIISQLLSLNGFEFFPLQNFMNIDKNSWVDSFKINNNGVYDNISTSFVCMYVGGSASYPSVSGNGFEPDGIIDLSMPGVSDFSTKKFTNDDINKINEKKQQSIDNLTEDEKQLSNNNDFPWREVRAFRVRFGQQNQSMFSDIKIDSKEYPETNESIQILSRLAGDNNPDAPVPKGQSLYNLYENRSYKATITGLGNAMIQPTQYFQLENIPLFNGAYIILNVEHDIVPNKMTTKFSGTKLLRYPIPRVLNPMAFTTFNPSEQSAAELVISASVVNNRVKTHYTAMYNNTENSLKTE